MFEMNHFKSIDELVKFFPTEQSCIDFLERQRWGDHVVSPYDPDSKVYKCKGNRYKCKNTGSISTSGQTRSSRTRKCR